LIHNECHKKAVVAKRSRDEWETSFLHNNNTRCNALLPLWGPEVTESDFSTQMARFNESVRDATGVSPDVTWIIHNIKLTLHRFTTNGKFYLDAGGGGPESNMKFLPHLIHYILYTTNTLKSQSSLKIPIQSFLDDFNISSAWAVTGYYYKATSALIVFSKEEWLKCRVDFLKKMLMCTHMREVSINQKKGVTEAERKELPFQKYKTTILFWYLVDQILDKLLDAQAITDSAGAEYTEKLQMYIRNNTVALQKASEKLAKTFNEEFIVVDSLEEFIDVANLYSVLEPTLVNDAISQIQEDTSSEA
jgi:E3 ubiquitin-protein ligase UBR4